MNIIDFTGKGLTYLLLSLKKHERQLLSKEEEDLEGIATDLIFVQSLQARIRSAKAANEA